MSTKEEILHLIDELPEKQLSDILRYLKEIERDNKPAVPFSKDLDKIMHEDENLLKELAK
jgi:hypothetical protein